MPRTVKERLQARIAAKKAAEAAASGAAPQEQRARSEQEVQSMLSARLEQLKAMQAAQESQSSSMGSLVINASKVVMDGQISGANVQIDSDYVTVARGAKFNSGGVSIRADILKNKSKIKAKKIKVVANEISGSGKMSASEAGIVSAESIGKQKIKGKIVYGGEAAEKLNEFLKSTPEDITKIQRINANIYADFLAYEFNKNTKKANQYISKMEKSLGEPEDPMIRKFVDDAYNIRFLNLVEARKYLDARYILEKMDDSQKSIYKPILESIIQAEEKKKSYKKKKAKPVLAQDTSEAASEEIAKREEELQKKREEEAKAAQKRSQELEEWRAKEKATKAAKEAAAAEAAREIEAEVAASIAEARALKAAKAAAAEAAKKDFPEDVGSFVVDVETGNIDISNLPSILSQAYFHYKACESKNKNPLSVLSTSIEWQIEGKEIYRYSPESEESKVYKINDIPNYYAAISWDLGEVNPVFKDALEHGRFSKGGAATKSHSTSGLKAFDNIVELKIKGAKGTGDERLFTDTVYDDGNGNKLVVLDHEGYHVDVARLHKAGASTNLIKLHSYEHEEAGAAAAYPVDDSQEFYLKALGSLGVDFASE